MLPSMNHVDVAVFREEVRNFYISWEGLDCRKRPHDSGVHGPCVPSSPCLLQSCLSLGDVAQLTANAGIYMQNLALMFPPK